MSVYEKLRELNIEVPAPTPAMATFVPAVRTGNLLFVSGHIATKDGKPWTGRLGAGIATPEGQQAARAVAIDLLSTLNAALGDLNKIRRIVKLLVLVASTPEFAEQHLVANGASQLFAAVFADRGSHARSAIGIVGTPLGACVEIELIAEVD